jgi:hypothetical protein
VRKGRRAPPPLKNSARRPGRTSATPCGGETIAAAPSRRLSYPARSPAPCLAPAVIGSCSFPGASLSHTHTIIVRGGLSGESAFPAGGTPRLTGTHYRHRRDRRPLLTSDLLSRRRTCPEPCSPEIARSRHTGAMAAHSRTRIWSPRAYTGRTFLIANQHGYYAVARASDSCPNTPPRFVGAHQPDRVNTPSIPTHPGTHNASRDGGVGRVHPLGAGVPSRERRMYR